MGVGWVGQAAYCCLLSLNELANGQFALHNAYLAPYKCSWLVLIRFQNSGQGCTLFQFPRGCCCSEAVAVQKRQIMPF